MTRPTCDVIIPTWQGERHVPGLLTALSNQRHRPVRILVIDSGSTDHTAELARAGGAEVVVIAKGEFNHGGTRNRAARLCTADILVFMTQDALPADDLFLESLCAALGEPGVEAAYARQEPYPYADPPEVFARSCNYPETAHRRTQADIERMGVRAYFFSNVASAVRRTAFLNVGGFPERVPMNEDMVLCARILQSGGTVAYTPTARVLHSHNYSIRQQAGRYFDIGAFFAEQGDLLPHARIGGEGLRFALGQMSFLLRTGRPLWLLRSPFELVAKWISYKGGRLHRWLPLWLKCRWSMHAFYWRSSPP